MQACGVSYAVVLSGGSSVDRWPRWEWWERSMQQWCLQKPWRKWWLRTLELEPLAHRPDPLSCTTQTCCIWTFNHIILAPAGGADHSQRVVITFVVQSYAPKHFILVHGMGGGAWFWFEIVTLLEHYGYEATTVDLTAHGINKAIADDVTTAAEYTKPLLDAIDNAPGPVRIHMSLVALACKLCCSSELPNTAIELSTGISSQGYLSHCRGDLRKSDSLFGLIEWQVILVGHSLGGGVIAYASEVFSTKVSKAIYLSAVTPSYNQSMFGGFPADVRNFSSIRF